MDWGAQPGALPGDDVDSFIRREGPAAFQRLIDSARPAGEWVILQAARQLGPDAEADERAAVVQRLLEVIRRTADPVLHAAYRRRVAAIGQVDELTIANMLGERLFKPRRQHRGGVSMDFEEGDHGAL